MTARQISIIFILVLCFKIHALINGEIASKDQNPFAMQIWSMEQNKLKIRCSGTLIAPDVVITEKSCLYDQDNQRRGETFLISNSTRTDFSKPLSNIMQKVLATVRSDVKHPRENLVLLYLNQAVPIKPAVLLQNDESHQLFNPGASYVSGWGFSQPRPQQYWYNKITNFLFGTGEQRQMNSKHIGLTHIGGLTDRTLEFGYEQNDAIGCIGDEGGPITIHIKTPFVNSERLVGIVSSNSNLAECISPSYGLRLDTLTNFIHEQLVWGCQKGYRAWCHIQGLLPPGFDEDEEPEVIPNPQKMEAPPKKESAEPPTFKAETQNKTLHEDTQEQKPKNQVKNLKIKMESMGCRCMRSTQKKM